MTQQNSNRSAATRWTNDFAIKVANVNGSGSASANSLIYKSIFRSGVPVSAKNIFPSNIQGLPTWFEIRVNGDGHISRSATVDLVVAMNPQTMEEDMQSVRSAGYFLYDSTRHIDDAIVREDVTLLPVPLTQLGIDAFPSVKTRLLMKNITYVGALAALLDIDLAILKELLDETYSKKPDLAEANMKAVTLSHDFVREHYDCPLPIRVERMDATAGTILINGNTACALGALYAGATVVAWYPITPATSVTDAFRHFCSRYRRDPQSGLMNAAVIQAEDELAAAGMAIGAGWAGARAFTPTSGAGISLMNEFIGFAYFTEIPVVFFDIQRVGPSTGMPTRTQQGDILEAAYASHGDTKHIVLFPGNPEECFYLSVAAFDLAERYQTPVFVLSDLDIGMNEWMTRRLEWDDSYRPDRGKVLSAEELEEITDYGRYLDVDGDGIPRRTLPGVHPNGAYFLRGSGHNKHGKYTEKADEYQEVVDRLRSKVESAAARVPAPVIEYGLGGCPKARHGAQDDPPGDAAAPGSTAGPGARELPEAPAPGTTSAGSDGGSGTTAAGIDGGPRVHDCFPAPVGIVTVGSCDLAVREALEILGADGGGFDYLRIRAFPFGADVVRFLEEHEACFVIEQNRDGQLRSLLVLETPVAKEKLVSVTSYGGMPLDAQTVAVKLRDAIRRAGTEVTA